MYKHNYIEFYVLILFSVLTATRASNITFECPTGWDKIGTHCYKFVNLRMDFEDAKDVCDKYGARLLVIRDEVEAKNVSDVAVNRFSPSEHFWIYNGRYEQDSGKGSLNSTFCKGMWQPNEPRETEEDVAVASNMQGRWALTWVWTNLPFVCRTPACPTGSHRCSDGTCLNMKWKCDGTYDCLDLSDENNCTAGVAYYTSSSGAVDTSKMNASGDFYQWVIEGQPGEIFELEFETLTIKDNMDIVRVYSGGPSVVTSDLIKEIKNNQSVKLSVFSKNHFLIITLQSYTNNSQPVLKFNWKPDNEASWKQVTIVNVTDSDTPISSPYYNTSETPVSFKREWLLTVPEGELITLEILDNNLELNASLDFYIVTSVGFVLQELNSHKAIYISSKNSMSLIVKTRSFKKHFNFNAKFRKGCDFMTNLTLATFALKNLPVNHSCSWTVRNEVFTNFSLQINETSFGLSNVSDFLQIYSSTDRNSTPLNETLKNTGWMHEYEAESGVFSFTYSPDMFHPTMELSGRIYAGCKEVTNSTTMYVTAGIAATELYRAQFSCPVGFRFKQEEYSNNTTLSAVCNEGGRWYWGSPSFTRTPECQIVYCGYPPPVLNSFVSNIYGNVTFGSVAAYQCFYGFGLVGDSNVTCHANGTWSVLPSCVANNCSAIPNVTHGSRNSSDVSVGSIVTFSCDPGYSLQGARTIACMSNQTWSHPLPKCKELTCPLPVLEHGHYEHTSIPKFGESVSLVCDAGYQINRTQTQNDTSIKCDVNRTLSVENDTCVDVDECNSSSANNCSSTEDCVNLVGSYICVCKSGFNGPDCKDVDECALGMCNQNCTNLPGSYSCSCYHGYVLYTENGTNGFYIPAGEDGLKPGDVFQINNTCVPVTCDKVPQLPENGTALMSRATYYYNESVNIVCDFGYKLDNSSVATCQSDGNWTYSTKPACKKLTCSQPPVIKHEDSRVPAKGDIEPGASLTITCNFNDGSGNVTNKTVFCAPSPDVSGQFSLQGDNLTCPEVDCGKPLNIPGGNTANVTNTTYGSSFEFSCDVSRGFNVTGASTLGNATVVCQSNGRWGFANLTCEGLRCKDPGTMAGTVQIVNTSYEIDQIVQYNCTRPGFTTVTNDTLVCEYKNGQVKWSGDPPTCKDAEKPVIKCPTVKPSDLYSTLVYDDPYVLDNSGFSCLILESGHPSEVSVVTSNVTVRYKATDTQNESSCEFNVTVKDRSEPAIKCPLGHQQDLAGSRYVLVNLTALVSHSGDGTVMFDPTSPLNVTEGSVYPVRVNITKTNGLVKGCAFLVTAALKTCSNETLPALDNGTIENCAGNGNKMTCVGVCDEGYLFQNGTNSTSYSCVNGVWSVDSLVQSCIKMNGVIYNYNVSLKYDFNGTKLSTPAQYKHELCSDTHCRSLSHHVENISACGYNNFRVINCNNKEFGRTDDKTSFTLQLMTADGNETGLQNCNDTLQNQSMTLFGPTYPGSGTMSCLSPWSVQSGPVDIVRINISCNNNSLMVDYSGRKYCLPCGRGMYFNTTTKTCEQCQDGYYQDEEGQEVCKKCPTGLLKSHAPRTKKSHCFKLCPEGFVSTTGYIEDNCTQCPENYFSNSSDSCQSCPNNGSTLGISGATSVTQCSDPCSPGEYSVTGFKPCSACPKNFYSDSQGAKLCAECPSKTITAGNGSKSFSDCVNGSSLCTVDFCNPNGTDSNSVCEVFYHRPVCSCKPGFYGDSCNKSCDVCTPNPCYNDGLCTASGLNFSCACKNETICTFIENHQIGYSSDQSIAPWFPYGNDTCRDLCFNDTACVAYRVDDPNSCYHYKTLYLDPTANNTDESYAKKCSEKQLFHGPLCEIDLINDCNDEVCFSKDFCMDLVGGTECHCPYDGGSYDSKCAKPDHLCQSNNCSLHGNCISDGSLRAVCECDPGYTGERCETDINECDINTQGCLYNGSCQDGVNNYSCSCVNGFSGSHCEILADFCHHNDCKVADRGICTNDFQNFTASCTCGEHYTPDSQNPGACVPINYCLSNPCVNGTCINVTDGFRCDCSLGFEGSQCQHNIDDCVNHMCENGATCLDGVSNYTCTCSVGFTGYFCDVNIVECSGKCVLSNLQSTCLDLVEDYYCPCKPAYNGKNCSDAVNMCTAYEPCLNGGNCSDFTGGYNCTCAAGWTGDNCEQEINHCSPNPCQNNGTCYNLVDQYFCKCLDGTSDKNCQPIEKPCDKFSDSVCSSNGKCQPFGETIECQCLGDYSGVACELEKDHCAGDPCNGGICTQNHLTYVCDCSNVKGYSGPNCNKTEQACSSCPVNTTSQGFNDPDGYHRCACVCHANETLVGDTCLIVDSDYDLAFLESFANKSTFLTSESGFYLDKNSSLSVSMWVAAAKPLDDDKFILALRSSDANSSFLSVFNTKVQFTTNENVSVNFTEDIGKKHSLDELFSWHLLSIVWSTNGSLRIMFDFLTLNQTQILALPPSEKFVFVQLGQSFYGYISQVSVWKTALTPSDHYRIYGDKLAVPQPDSLVLGWTPYSFDSSVKRTRSSTATEFLSICNITNTIAQMGLNRPECKNIKLTDKTPPKVNYCNESTVLLVDYSKHQVNSSELGYEFTDDYNRKQLLPEGQLYSYGAYDIAVTAEDSAGNIGVCMTRTYITPNQCSDTELSFVAKCSDNTDGGKVTCPPGTLPSVPTPNFVSCSSLRTYNLDNMYEKPDRIVCGEIKPLSVIVNMTLPYQIVVDCNEILVQDINAHLTSIIKTLNNTWEGLCSDAYCSNVNSSGHCTGHRSLTANVQIGGLNASLSAPGLPAMTPLEIMKMAVSGKDNFNIPLVADAYVEIKQTTVDEISSCIKGYSSAGIYCVQCGPGSYYDEGEQKCKLCELNTYSANPGNSSCTPCPADTVTLQRGSSSAADCKEKCPKGQMLNLTTDECVSCPINFYQDHEGKSYCFPCPPATETVNNGTISQADCREICKPGTELKGQVCVECQRGFYRPGDIQGGCSPCPLSNYTTRGNGSISEDECNIPRCPPGQFVQDNGTFTCQLCDYGKYQPDEAEFDCIPCDVNFTTENMGETNDSMCRLTCPEGEEDINGTCVSCSDDHFKQTSGFDQCMNCTGDFTSTASNRSFCTEIFCDVGRERIAGNCSDCDYRYYKPSRGNYSCTECPLNSTTAFKGSTSDLNCSLAFCPAGSYLNETTNNCSLCERGTYQDLPGKNNCISCVSNYTTQFEGSVNSSQCYKICPQGNYRNGTGCLPCPVGQYQNESDQTSCKTCGKFSGYNTSTVSTKTVNEGDCFPICPEGFHLDKEKRLCSPCPVGTYKSAVNLNTTCESCKANFSTLHEQETSPDACILDKCTKGYYRNVSSSECTPCPVGEYQDSDLLNVTACTKCPNGTITLFDGAPIMDDYCIQNCSEGEELHTTFKNCSACPPGMYRPEGVREPPTCFLCPPGQTTVKTKESKCIPNPNQDSTSPMDKIDLSLDLTLSVQDCSHPEDVKDVIKKIVLQLIENQNKRYDGICPSNCYSDFQIDIDNLCGKSFRSKRQTSGNATVHVSIKQIDAAVRGKDGQLRPSMAALMEAFYDLYPVNESLTNFQLSIDSVKGVECGSDCVVGSFHYPQICVPGQFAGVDKCEPCANGSYSTHPVSHKCEPCPDGQTTATDGAGINASSCDGICATTNNYCGDKGKCVKNSENKHYCHCDSDYTGVACTLHQEPEAEDDNLKIVIGVTVGVGALLLILLIICGVFAYRRKAAKRESATTSLESESDVTHIRFPRFNYARNWFDPFMYQEETIHLPRPSSHSTH